MGSVEVPAAGLRARSLVCRPLPQERCDNPCQLLVNGLACFSLRGSPDKVEVRLNTADGFAAPSACDCDFVYVLEKSKLHSLIGMVSWERKQAIKARLKEVLRL
jgi:hypothetical protein